MDLCGVQPLSSPCPEVGKLFESQVRSHESKWQTRPNYVQRGVQQENLFGVSSNLNQSGHRVFVCRCACVRISECASMLMPLNVFAYISLCCTYQNIWTPTTLSSLFSLVSRLFSLLSSLLPPSLFPSSLLEGTVGKKRSQKKQSRGVRNAGRRVCVCVCLSHTLSLSFSLALSAVPTCIFRFSSNVWTPKTYSGVCEIKYHPKTFQYSVLTPLPPIQS